MHVKHSLTGRSGGVHWIPMRCACSALLVLIAFASGGVAWGQDRARGQGVMDVARPDYDAAGIRLGSFLLYPALELGAGYDSNVFAEDKSAKDAAFFPLSLPIVLDSDWTRHALSIAAAPSYRFHTGEPSEDYWEVDVSGDARLDVLEFANFTPSISFRHLTESRGAIDAVQLLAEPTEYDELDFTAAWNQRFNRVSASIGGGWTQLDYDDNKLVAGGKFDQDFRDRGIAQGIGRVGYSFAKGQSAFVRGSVNHRNYRKKSLPARDSFGWEVVAGWASELSNLVAGEIYVGYLDQDYKAGFGDVSGVSFGTDLEWYVTELVTLKASAARDVTESTSPGVGGILRTTAALGADYELLRNLLANCEVSYERGDFKGSPREDDRIRASVGGTYLVSRNVHIDLGYSYENRWAQNAPGLDFQRHQVLLGVRLQL